MGRKLKNFIRGMGSVVDLQPTKDRTINVTVNATRYTMGTKRLERVCRPNGRGFIRAVGYVGEAPSGAGMYVRAGNTIKKAWGLVGRSFGSAMKGYQNGQAAEPRRAGSEAGGGGVAPKSTAAARDGAGQRGRDATARDATVARTSAAGANG